MTLAAVSSSRRVRGFRALAALWAGAWLLLVPARAKADPSPVDKASAQALFDEGKKLLRQKNYAEACPKLAESMRFEPTLGTKLNLADCYEKNGQTASAWALFIEAAEQAKSAGQSDRMKKASDRAAALSLRLCRLRIDVAVEAEVTGVEVKRDGTLLGAPSWGTSAPLDPGEHRIEAEALGKKPFSVVVTLKDGDTNPVVVLIPALEDLPKPAPPPEPLPPPPKVDPTPPPPPTSAPTVAPAPTGPPKAAPRAPPPKRAPPVDVPTRTSTARSVGYALTAVGGVGAGVGSVFGLVALLKKSDSALNCKQSNACNVEGTHQREAALGFANVASVTLIAGAGVFVAGISTLVATREPDATEKLVLKAIPLVGPNIGGLMIQGAF